MTIEIAVTLPRKQFQLELKASIPASGFTAVYGHSGAGKTSLLRWLAGLEQSAHGSLNFSGTDWQNGHSNIPTHQRQIAYVFQDARLFPFLTVEKNLLYAYQRRFNKDGPTIAQVCQWFNLAPLLQQQADEVSAGQAQRVAIARAVLSSPRLILMDEPLASLDATSKSSILAILEQLHQHLDIPVIYVSHNIDEILRLADYLMVLEQGKMIAQGPLLELCSRLDLNISHDENAASIITTHIVRHDTHYKLTQLSIADSANLFIAQTQAEVGSPLQVHIPARDVSIALSAPTDTSILNIIRCTIDAIENSNDTRTLVRLIIAGQFMLARLTKKSVDRLQLYPGQQVFAQIKTVALLNE